MPEGVTQLQLWLRGGRVNCGHVAVALIWGMVVWHSPAVVQDAKILILTQMRLR